MKTFNKLRHICYGSGGVILIIQFFGIESWICRITLVHTLAESSGTPLTLYETYQQTSNISRKKS